MHRRPAARRCSSRWRARTAAALWRCPSPRARRSSDSDAPGQLPPRPGASDRDGTGALVGISVGSRGSRPHHLLPQPFGQQPVNGDAMLSMSAQTAESAYKDRMKILLVEDDREAAEYLEK